MSQALSSIRRGKVIQSCLEAHVEAATNGLRFRVNLLPSTILC